MWVVPGAQQRFIRNKSQGVRDKTLGLILHVQDGNGELTGWFNNPGSDASSAWQVMKTGKVFQFGDPDVDKFWTQGAGNPDYGAVETEGYPGDALTPEQVEGVARIYAKGHLEEGWPFQLAEKPGERGLGWHGMGGAAWGGHYNCPGNLRKAQRATILARARQIVTGSTTQRDEFDMATLADLQAAIASQLGAIAEKVWQCAIYNPLLADKNNPKGKPVQAQVFLQSINANAYQARIDAAVARSLAEAHAKAGRPLTAAETEAATKAGTKSALDEVIAGANIAVNFDVRGA